MLFLSLLFSSDLDDASKRAAGRRGIAQACDQRGQVALRQDRQTTASGYYDQYFVMFTFRKKYISKWPLLGICRPAISTSKSDFLNFVSFIKHNFIANSLNGELFSYI